MTESNLPGPVVRNLRLLSLTLLGALIALCLAWELWLAPTGSGTLALKVLPLCFCVIGLLRHRMYTYRWLSLLIWLYFMEGTVRATSERGLSAVLAGFEVLLSLLLFTVATVYIRKRLKSAPAATEAAV
jgi:uncharacterized membrane protein